MAEAGEKKRSCIGAILLFERVNPLHLLRIRRVKDEIIEC